MCADLLALYGGSGGIQFLTLHHPPVALYDVTAGAPVLVTPVPSEEPWYTKILLALDELGAREAATQKAAEHVGVIERHPNREFGEYLAATLGLTAAG